jgi:SAM-dependent methyltransferase
MKRGLDAHGVDFSSWAIERANSVTKGRCRRLDMDLATSTDFAERFNFIVLHSVIEHVSDPERLLKVIFEIAEPGAVIYIQTLNADSLMHCLLGRDWAGYTDYTHKSPWLTPDWLTDTAEKIGFSLLTIEREGVWNENSDDPVWRSFCDYLRLPPAAILLKDRFGDVVTLILRRPALTRDGQ